MIASLACHEIVRSFAAMIGDKDNNPRACDRGAIGDGQNVSLAQITYTNEAYKSKLFPTHFTLKQA